MVQENEARTAALLLVCRTQRRNQSCKLRQTRATACTCRHLIAWPDASILLRVSPGAAVAWRWLVTAVLVLVLLASACSVVAGWRMAGRRRATWRARRRWWSARALRA